MSTLSQVVEKFTRNRKSAEDIESDLAAQRIARDADQAAYAAACLDVVDEIDGAEKRKRAVAAEIAKTDERIADLQLALQGAQAREQAAAKATADAIAAEERAKAQRIKRAAIEARQRDADRLLAIIPPFVEAYRALMHSQGGVFAAMNAGHSASGLDLDGTLLRWEKVDAAIRAQLWRNGLPWDEERFRGSDLIPEWSFEAAHNVLRQHAGLPAREA